MPLTNAEKQARHRTRKAEKMARYERALVLIASGISHHAGDHVDIAKKALD